MGKDATILHILSGDLWAGAEAQILLQLRALLDRGLDVHAVVFNPGIPLGRLQQAGIPCLLVDERSSPAAWLRRGLAAARDINPALIVTHGYKEALLGAIAATRLRIPLITTFHGAPEIHSGISGAKARLYGAVHNWIARKRAARIITVSHALAKELGFGGLDKVRVVFNVTETANAAAEQSAVKLEHPALSIVGRLVKVKRVDLAIRAFAVLSTETTNARLYIVGDGPEKEALQALAASLGRAEHVRFLGFREDSAQIIAASDLLLISSEREGIPTVMLEAALHGTPLLSTPLPGVKEALEAMGPYPAFFSADRSPEAFAAEIKRALGAGRADPAATRPAVEQHFLPASAAAKLHAIYRELVTL